MKKESQDRCDVTDCCHEELQATRSYLATLPFVLGRGTTPNLGGKHFLILGPETGRIWWLKKVQYLQKKYHCHWTFLRGKKTKWIFHNLGNLLRAPESIPVSRERAVPTEWQVRTILGDCISKAWVITVQAPQYRQRALISDFLEKQPWPRTGSMIDLKG